MLKCIYRNVFSIVKNERGKNKKGEPRKDPPGWGGGGAKLYIDVKRKSFQVYFKMKFNLYIKLSKFIIMVSREKKMFSVLPIKLNFH